MAGLELALLLLAASAGLRLLAERWRIPYATLLVLGGLALALVPNLPRITLSPDVLFLIFVPPLLYWGSVSFPLRDLRRESGPILRLAVLMVLVSTAAVAAVIHTIDPAFTWAAAVVLGAIISPPDPVAVLSLTRWVRLPSAVARILEGEGLLNDATALVTYRLAVAAAVTGTFALMRGALQFLIVGAGGVIVGIVAGMIVMRVRLLTRRIDVVDNTISLLTPFAVYLAAEAIDTSGVLAVTAAAMYIARNIQRIGGPASRLQATAMWTVTTFLLESLVFIFIGIELPLVLRDLRGTAIPALLGEAGLIYLTIVLTRMIWVFPSTYVGRRIDRWLRQKPTPLPTWRTVLFVGWAGVRGGDSLVIALALPLATAAGQPFPARSRIIFVAFCVILATLVIQGPTLRPVARLLGLHGDGSAEDEEAHARLAAAEAGLRALDAVSHNDDLRYPEVARYLRQRHRQRARRWAAREAHRFGDRPDIGDHQPGLLPTPSHEAGELDEGRAVEYRKIRSAMIAAELEALVDLRDTNVIGDGIMRDLARELDLEQTLLDSSQPVVESPREVNVPPDGGA